MAKVKITKFGLLAGTNNTVYVAWTWDKAGTTDHYRVVWYRSWDRLGIAPFEESTVKGTYHQYTAPSEVVNSPTGHVSVTILPVAKTKTDANGKQSTPWTAEWSTVTNSTKYYFNENPPTDTPSAPDVSIEDYTLTAQVDNVDDSIEKVKFQVVKNNAASAYATKTARVKSNHASYAFKIEAGGKYKVRCQYINDNGESDWSPWSNEITTKPSAPRRINMYRAESETSVYLAWDAVENADSYEIEYATKKEYFEGSNQTTIETGITTSTYILGGMESGQEYFFRIRAANSQGESDWTDIVSVIVGTEPAAPTTWSSTTTVITGEQLTLYWVHNSEDGSPQTKANVELTIDGVTSYHEIDTASEEDDEKTMHYAINTSGYIEGVTILWRIQTAGATKKYGEWSVQRTIKVYAPPTAYIRLTDVSDNEVENLSSFPLFVDVSAGPKTQTPVGYHFTVVSNSYYETVDNVGIRKIVNKGDEVYSTYVDTSSYTSTIKLSADNVDLVNNVTYTVHCVLSMDSGLTGEDSCDFTVTWEDELYEPNAEISIDPTDLTALIRPYCENTDGEPIEDITLSVYRREFDGSFTEIMTGLDNGLDTFITDPHPSLDYARYRVVARFELTGAISYYDLPGIPVGEKAVVIQWDEVWQPYEHRNYMTDEMPWSGSMLKLPYNINMSEDNKIDISLIEYIGRKHPVSYYGTQVGQSQSWSVDIPKTDAETIYALRRLAVWMGDVYIREPSGSGYWASVSVSFSQNHLEVKIPVKISITRVAGGM